MDEFSPVMVAARIGATIRDSLRMAGRARRTDVLLYWGAATLIRLVLPGMLDVLLPLATARPVMHAIALSLILPGIALFARRMHDQDRTGWWAGMLVAVAAWAAWPRDAAAVARLRMNPGADGGSLLVALACVAILIAQMQPGTVGPNRFGPDPRPDRRR